MKRETVKTKADSLIQKNSSTKVDSLKTVTLAKEVLRENKVSGITYMPYKCV